MSGEKINLKNLWIGDKVKIIDLDKIGVFEGLTKDNLAQIKCEGKVIICSEENVSMYLESEPEFELTFDDHIPLKKSLVSKKTKFNPSLDLHIEKLNPDLINADPGVIVDFQLQKCKVFIEEAISLKMYKITIIHGKGEGRLKEYVHQMLSSYHEVKFMVLTNKDGATEVLLM
ncbi:MAG: hypothetical protein RLZZ546_868 [Bacteroidota bacterium]